MTTEVIRENLKKIEDRKRKKSTTTKKIQSVHYKEEVDKETGEIEKKREIKEYTFSREEDYIKVYLKHVMYLNNLPQGLHPLIYEIIQYVGYGNQIVINSTVKRRIAEKLGTTFGTINVYITNLVKKDILIRIDKGIYVLNPVLFGKGNWAEIVELREALQINVIYTEEGMYFEHLGKAEGVKIQKGIFQEELVINK